MAARRAREMQMPLRAIEKNLKTWSDKGIRDVDGAKAELETRKAGRDTGRAAGRQPVSRATTYSQRTYDDRFLNTLVPDIGDGDEK